MTVNETRPVKIEQRLEGEQRESCRGRGNSTNSRIPWDLELTLHCSRGGVHGGDRSLAMLQVHHRHHKHTHTDTLLALEHHGPHSLHSLLARSMRASSYKATCVLF